MSEQIVVGDWLVGGTTREDLDWSRIVEIDGVVATVAWEGSQMRTTCELSPDDVEVFGSRAAAQRRYQERLAALSS